MSIDAPLYLQVADQLEAEIATLASGEPLPSEHELARDHDIARLTARAVLEELERRYLVRRQQGRRTVVARRIDYPLDVGKLPGWTKIVRRAGAVPRTEIDYFVHRQAPAPVRTTLGLGKRDAVFHLGRRRFVDDELAAYSESWIVADLVPGFAEAYGAVGTFNASLRRLEVKMRRAVARCELVVAPPAIAAKLEALERPLVFMLATQLYVQKRALAISTNWLRADAFNVVVELRGNVRRRASR